MKSQSFQLHPFVATLKHDRGKIKLTVLASSETTARHMIMKAEGCPESAIVKLRKSTRWPKFN